MIVVDIGNTNTVIGIYKNKRIKKTIRLITKDNNFKKNLSTSLTNNYIKNLKIINKLCVISSVTPSKNNIIINFFKSFDYKILNVNIKNIPKNIKFNYASNQLGADRIANTFAAIEKYGKNSIVIDFGTATTFDIVINNIYEGGVISPGIKISHDALVQNASKLQKISIKKVKSIIGKNTKQSMQSGFYWGYINIINGILNRIIKEKKINPKIILTGGLGSIFKNDIKFKTYYEPNLTLEGLYLIGLTTYA